MVGLLLNGKEFGWRGPHWGRSQCAVCSRFSGRTSLEMFVGEWREPRVRICGNKEDGTRPAIIYRLNIDSGRRNRGAGLGGGPDETRTEPETLAGGNGWLRITRGAAS